VLAMKKNNLFQLSQYDVTQQIIETQSIADDLNMSISTVYKILSNLEELTLVYVDKYKISDAGKKIKFYKSRIKKAEIVVGGITPTLNLQSN
jgi:predicted transcriptional regulator